MDQKRLEPTLSFRVLHNQRAKTITKASYMQNAMGKSTSSSGISHSGSILDSRGSARAAAAGGVVVVVVVGVAIVVKHYYYYYYYYY